MTDSLWTVNNYATFPRPTDLLQESSFILSKASFGWDFDKSVDQLSSEIATGITNPFVRNCKRNEEIGDAGGT